MHIYIYIKEYAAARERKWESQKQGVGSNKLS